MNKVGEEGFAGVVSGSSSSDGSVDDVRSWPTDRVVEQFRDTQRKLDAPAQGQSASSQMTLIAQRDELELVLLSRLATSGWAELAQCARDLADLAESRRDQARGLLADGPGADHVDTLITYHQEIDKARMAAQRAAADGRALTYRYLDRVLQVAGVRTGDAPKIIAEAAGVTLQTVYKTMRRIPGDPAEEG